MRLASVNHALDHGSVDVAHVRSAEGGEYPQPKLALVRVTARGGELRHERAVPLLDVLAQADAPRAVPRRVPHGDEPGLLPPGFLEGLARDALAVALAVQREPGVFDHVVDGRAVIEAPFGYGHATAFRGRR